MRLAIEVYTKDHPKWLTSTVWIDSGWRKIEIDMQRGVVVYQKEPGEVFQVCTPDAVRYHANVQ